MVLICVDLAQHTPVTICLPHQMYRAKLAMILENNPGARTLTIMPYRNADKIEIKAEEI
ncbi:hypothetical protein [Geoalkalibacter sp.]|uniref:hypothetical protein n=1 Tax=Geoalkalibacter sp. TaxID=3041440 RepID=UPI00272E83EE|nr:hypothetical protein [Geoalkalibacter sp.]